MKILTFQTKMLALSVFNLLVLSVPHLLAQDFQRVYGTTLDNSFMKVIQDGTSYFVLGQDEAVNGSPQHATVTRLDANGVHQWTLSVNTASIWNDAVLISPGELMVVGSTLPFDASTKSLIGRVTITGGGNFTWLNAYDVANQESFTRVVKNPAPGMNSPYYVLGFQNQPGSNSTTEDVVLLNLNANGTFLWKKKYASQGDDEFFSDLEALPSGDLLIAGRSSGGGPGLIYKVDNAGVQFGGVQIAGYTFNDVSRSLTGDIYATANTSGQAHVLKFDQDLLLMWDILIPEFTSVRQVFEGFFGEIYVVGRGSFGGIDRHVVLHLTDVGTPPNSVDWVRYLNSGNAINNGFAWWLQNGQIAFSDTRIIPGGFGQNCAFLSVSDKDMATCNVSDAAASLIFADPVPDGPVGPGLDFQDVFPPMTHQASPVNWQQQEVCSLAPCGVTIAVTQNNNCGLVTVCANASGPGPHSYQWCSGESTQCITKQIPSCAPFEFCVSVTCADGTQSNATQTFTPIDIVPPVIMCPPSVQKNCGPAGTGPIDTGFATATDNCSTPTVTYTDVLSGIMPCDASITRTWKATDDCGNMSTCVQTITVIDNVPPTLTNCPQNVTVTGVLGPNGLCSANVQVASPTATDNCDQSVTLTNSFSNTANASGTYPQGSTTVVWTATDDCGRTATCSFLVTVSCGQSSIFKCGMAVVSCFSNFLSGSNNTVADPNGAVIGLVDLRNHATAPLGTNWQAGSSSIVHSTNWKSQNMGQVFGVTIDNNYNVYASSSTIYGKYMPPTPPAGGFGNVYKIDAGTGAVTIFANLPQAPGNPAGLGDVWYDEVSNQIYVSNFYDGLIYRYNIGGVFQGIYDFLGTALGTPSPGFIARGERIWAVATHNGRLYFSVWNEDRARPEPTMKNQIWSVPLVAGVPTGAAVLERDIPDLLTNNFSSPVSDINFSETGIMLVAERSMNNDFGDAANGQGAQAHAARIFEFSGTNWATAKIFYVGNASSNHVNSSGGIDYGYESFDPTISPMPMLCDSIIWGTGDALRFPAYNVLPDVSTLPCGGSTGDYVYGLAGIPQSGNSNLPIPANTYVKNSSIYIDVDNNLCLGEKTQIGDVDVFKNCIACPSQDTIPCDSLMVMIAESPVGNQCCFDVDIKNNFGPSISKLQIDLCTPGVIFNTSQINVAAGFQYAASNSDQTLCITHTSGSIPAGMSNNIIRFCYSGLSGPGTFPQTLKFTWYQKVGGVDVATDCIDTTHTDCILPPPMEDPCVVVTPLEVHCDPTNVYQYILNFKVTNLSTLPSFNAYSVNLYGLPAGFTFSPCVGPPASLGNISIPIPGAPLLPGQMSGNMCVKIISSVPILSPQTICVQAKLIGIEACCTTADTFCFTIEPCCDPCESIAITTAPAHQDDSDCCYSLGIINNCPYPFFTKIEAEITTPGVTFGYNALNSSLIGFWTMGPSTNTKLCVRPINGTIPGGTIPDLFSFCLDNINNPSQVPQTIVIRWITAGANGQDSVACDTTLTFNCVANDYKCLLISDVSIVCQPDDDKYLLTFTVTNQSAISFCATSFDFIQLLPADLIFSPSASYTFSTPLCQGQSQTVSVCLFDTDGLPGSGNLIFIPKLSFMDGDTCCYEGIPVNIPLPPCDGGCHCAIPNLTMTTNSGGTFPLVCDEINQNLWPHLPCNSGAVTIAGNIGCVSNNPATNCPPIINWTLTGPNGFITSGNTTNGAISVTFTAAQVSAPGSYSFVTTTLCPGAGEACACYINWVQEACVNCVCAPTDLVVTQNGISQTLFCTQGAPTPALACPAGAVTVSGFFGCMSSNGMPCPVATPVTWTLTGPLGLINSGTLPNSAISLTFPVGQVDDPGMYSLTMSALCPGATVPCVCKVRWVREDCDSCECGEFTNLSWRPSQGAPNQPIVCGDSLTIGCLPAGYFVNFGGDFNCIGNNCPPPAISWDLFATGNPTPVLSGSGFPSIPATYFANPGVYQLVMVGECDGVVCDACVFTITSLGCPCLNNELPTNGLTGYFPFYNNTVDYSSTSVDGVLNGPSVTLGHDAALNNAFDFDGVNDWINGGLHNRGVTNAVSVAAWVKTVPNVNGQWIAGKYDFSADEGYLLTIGANGKASFDGRDHTNVYHSSGPSQKIVNDTAWHCVVGTAGNNEWKVYVDGGILPINLNSMPGSTVGGMAVALNPFTIGTHSDNAIGIPFWMNGDIDNVLVYNRVLTAEEVECFCLGLLPPDTCSCLGFEDLNFITDAGQVNVSCNNQPSVVLTCPTDTIGTFFFHGDLHCSDDCGTSVDWNILDASGVSHFAGSVSVNSTGGGIYHFDLPALAFSSFPAPGDYQIVLTGHCGSSTCVCLINFKVPPCEQCCTSYDDFCDRIENAVTVSTDNNLCKATLNVGDVGCEDYIEWVNWGVGTPPVIDFGPFPPGSMAMHTYPGSGTYSICYLAIERDSNGLICFEKLVCDTITLVCDSCDCQGDLTLFHGSSTIGINCNTNILYEFGCPVENISLSGYFGCFNTTTGAPCQPPTQVSWLLNRPGSLSDLTGTSGNSIAINFPALDVSAEGIYVLNLWTLCPGSTDTCFCKMQWNQLPCDSCCTDFDAFCQAVDAATTVTVDNTLCKATLNIGDLPCDDYIESVNWGDGQSSFGPFPGGSMPMHTYATSGAYTITYLAIERDPVTGLICFEKQLSDIIDLNCTDCVNLPNDLVGWWPMDDAWGNPSVVDISGGNHHGTPQPGGAVGSPNGPEPVPGIVADALQFISPVNEHVEVSDDPALNFGAGSFSIDAWVNSNNGTGTEPIVDKLGPLNSGYALSLQGSATPFYLTLVLGKGSSVQVLTGPPVVTGDWNYVAVSVNTQTQIATFYVGDPNTGTIAQSSVNIIGTNVASNTRPLLIGNNPLNLHWNIMIDELEIFNRALTTTELESIFDAGEFGKCKPNRCLCSNLSTDVEAGFTFSVVDDLMYQFQPTGLLDDCDEVTWLWGDGTAESQTLGRQTVAHSFLQSTPTEVTMSVKRNEVDGATCTESFSLMVNDAGSVRETSDIRLYPNPTSGDLTLQLKGSMPQSGQVQILDLLGRVVQLETLTVGQREHTFSLSALSASVYFVKVLDAGEPVWVEKVVKQ